MLRGEGSGGGRHVSGYQTSSALAIGALPAPVRRHARGRHLGVFDAVAADEVTDDDPLLAFGVVLVADYDHAVAI